LLLEVEALVLAIKVVLEVAVQLLELILLVEEAVPDMAEMEE
jgi:hypothetical protein